jgi:HEAT repeat protein
MKAVSESLNELLSIIRSQGNNPEEVRLRAISQLGDYLVREPDDTSLHSLLDMVRTETNPKLVIHAIGVLSRIRNTEALPLLIDALLATHIAMYENPPAPDFAKSDESLRLRCAAATALGKLGDERAIISLMSVLNDRTENYRLRLAAAESLGRLGDEYAVTPLINILSDEREKSVYLKESVAKALGMLGDIRALEPLIDLLEAKRGIRDKFNFLKEQIIEAIGRIGQPNRKVSDSLLKALQDEAPSIRLAALEALSTLGDGDCLEAVRACIFDADDDVAKAAVCTLYHLGGEAEIRNVLAGDNLPQFLRDELEGYIP